MDLAGCAAMLHPDFCTTVHTTVHRGVALPTDGRQPPDDPNAPFSARALSGRVGAVASKQPREHEQCPVVQVWECGRMGVHNICDVGFLVVLLPDR